jgi:hypothetical protein
MEYSKVEVSYEPEIQGPHPENVIAYKTCLPDEIDEAIGKKVSKYFDLVWYARKPPVDDIDNPYWENTPLELRQKCYNECAKVEELYPEEVAELKSPDNGDWKHGFNSGCLAAFRYVLDACDRSDWTPLIEQDPFYDPENPTKHDPLQHAEENFPYLDT